MAKVTVDIPLTLTGRYVEHAYESGEDDYVSLMFADEEIAKLKPQTPPGVWRNDDYDIEKYDSPWYLESDWDNVVSFTVARVLRDVLHNALMVQ